MNLMETEREARVEIGNWSGSGNAKDNGTKAGQDPIVILVSGGGGGGAPFYIQSPTPSNAFHISHQLTKVISFQKPYLRSTQSKPPPKPQPALIESRTPLPLPLPLIGEQQRVVLLLSTPAHRLHPAPTPRPATQPLVPTLALKHIIKEALRLSHRAHERLEGLRAPARTRRVLGRAP